MINKFCISKDTDGDYHISLPYKEPRLPDGKQIAHMNLSADMPVSKLIEVVSLFKTGNQKKINDILSNYL